MKIIVACDGREHSSYFETLLIAAPIAGADIIFVHVVDNAAANAWEMNAEHHWLRRRPGPREAERFGQAAEAAAHDILDEALVTTATWPAAARRAVVQTGNPEREIVRLALSESADLVVVGQHRIELGPHALGHCARYVVDHAPCSVLLVRGDEIRTSAPELLGHRLKQHGPPRHH